MIISTMLRKKVKGTPAEIASIRMGAIMAPIMANIGSNGLLITGIVMTAMNYSFFSFSTLPWLAIKQCLFMLILIISFAMLVPTGKKILALANAELTGPNAQRGASEELRTLVGRQYMTVMFVALLVLINMILGEAKSMMWVVAP
jgi:hypothetical protein